MKRRDSIENSWFGGKGGGSGLVGRRGKYMLYASEEGGRWQNKAARPWPLVKYTVGTMYLVPKSFCRRKCSAE
jgi:hypothetical protein